MPYVFKEISRLTINVISVDIGDVVVVVEKYCTHKVRGAVSSNATLTWIQL